MVRTVQQLKRFLRHRSVPTRSSPKIERLEKGHFMNQHDLFLVGRCLIAAMFIVSALGKAANWRTTVDLMRSYHLPFPQAALFTSVIAEFTGATFLLIGRFLFPTVVVLFTFVVFAMLAIPLQDEVNGKDRGKAISIIGSNLAILGALLLV
jgi:putative oxidoreductase